MSGGTEVLIAGVSARAFAESALRAGYSCRAVDAFGDADLKARLPAVGLASDLGLPYSASTAAVVARQHPSEAVAYVANFENHPDAVRMLAAGRRLLGNSAATLSRCRDPRALCVAVATAGERMPLTLTSAQVGSADPTRPWLRKPVHGGGGSGVRPWQPGAPLGRRELLQERVCGTLASAVFLADGRHARLLGLSRQLAGEPAFGAPAFRYCGSIYPLDPAQSGLAALDDRAGALADALTRAFGLVGINGFDFVLTEEGPAVLELNPRYVASAELIERALGISIFAAHAAGCGGALEAPALPRPQGAWGKAVVYARTDVTAGRTERWLERQGVRDVPPPGTHIRRGSPVCTVFARGADADDCRAGLEAAARAIEQELHDD